MTEPQTRRTYEIGHPDDHEDCDRMIGSLEARIAALARYADHRPGCACIGELGHPWRTSQPCDCGLDALLAALDATPPPSPPTLDVERLARALYETGQSGYDPDRYPEAALDNAQRVARKYAAEDTQK